MRHADEGQFLDALYDAAVDPDLWVPVMERFADAIGGSAGWLSRLNIATGNGASVVARIDPEMRQIYRSYYAGINPFMTMPKPDAPVVTDADWMDRSDLFRTEYFNDFMRPQDSYGCAIIRLGQQDGYVCSLSINRPLAHGRFDRSDLELAQRLQPHFRRAFRLTARLGDTAALKDDATLELSPHAVFILDERGMVRRGNPAADRLLAERAGLYVAHGRLSALRADDARRLDTLLAAASSDDAATRSGGSMALRTSRRALPLPVTVTPVRSERLAVFGQRPSVLVCVADAERPPGPSESQLRESFGLTPAEARVAMAVLDGVTAREAADRLGVSFHTVRHQIQSVLDKTGAKRRAELVALLSGTEMSRRPQ